ncbi:hypothetical protein AKJ16_DCAP23538, partial [Drosera capensis]
MKTNMTITDYKNHAELLKEYGNSILPCTGVICGILACKMVSIGYFFSDIGMIFWFYPSLGGMEYVLHHFLSMSGLLYAVSTGAYVVNGVAIFFTWLVARIILFLYLFYHVVLHYDEIVQLPSFGFFLIIVGPVGRVFFEHLFLCRGKFRRGALQCLLNILIFSKFLMKAFELILKVSNLVFPFFCIQ